MISLTELIIRYMWKKKIGPSRVRALALAAGRNEGGHYFM
jgi:hypothetical protein